MKQIKSINQNVRRKDILSVFKLKKLSFIFFNFHIAFDQWKFHVRWTSVCVPIFGHLTLAKRVLFTALLSFIVCIFTGEHLSSSYKGISWRGYSWKGQKEDGFRSSCDSKNGHNWEDSITHGLCSLKVVTLLKKKVLLESYYTHFSEMLHSVNRSLKYYI